MELKVGDRVRLVMGSSSVYGGKTGEIIELSVSGVRVRLDESVDHNDHKCSTIDVYHSTCERITEPESQVSDMDMVNPCGEILKDEEDTALPKLKVGDRVRLQMKTNLPFTGKTGKIIEFRSLCTRVRLDESLGVDGIKYSTIDVYHEACELLPDPESQIPIEDSNTEGGPMRFKEGERVKVVVPPGIRETSQIAVFRGEEGTIVARHGSSLACWAVEFDCKKDGWTWDCTGFVPNGKGAWVDERFLISLGLLPDEGSEKEESLPGETTTTKFKVWDQVKVVGYPILELNGRVGRILERSNVKSYPVGFKKSISPHGAASREAKNEFAPGYWRFIREQFLVPWAASDADLDPRVALGLDAKPEPLAKKIVDSAMDFELPKVHWGDIAQELEEKDWVITEFDRGKMIKAEAFAPGGLLFLAVNPYARHLRLCKPEYADHTAIDLPDGALPTPEEALRLWESR